MTHSVIEKWNCVPEHLQPALVQLLGVLLILVVNTVLALWLYGRTARREREAKRQDAYRKLLEPHVAQLTDALHQLLACSQTYLTARSEHWERQKRSPSDGASESGKMINWKQKADRAARDLKAIRPKLIVPLWGVSDELYKLTRLPNWLANKQDDSTARALLDRADELRRALTELVRDCFYRGSPPSDEEARVVHEHCAHYWKAWGSEIEPPEETLTLDSDNGDKDD